MNSAPLSRSKRSALEVASDVVKEAGNLLLEQVHSERQITDKQGRANFVTDADVLVENKIISLLQSEYPSHNILTEEASAIDNGSEFTWVIDPLDGTNNYIHGIPFYSVSIALTAGEDIIIGTVYDPWMKELFWAEKGAGAWLNDRRIAVSDQKSLSNAFIGSDLGYDAEAGRRFLAAVRNSWPQMFGLRIMGSAVLGLAYVACRRLGIYVHSCLYPWDVASGILLVREAGGIATDWDGNHSTIQNSQIIAGNSTLHEEFMKLMNERLQQ
ncbi:inositol monophosphatase family protein [Chloroflexota bacterium]